MICPHCKTRMEVVMMTKVENRRSTQFRCGACGYHEVSTSKPGGYGFSVRGGGTETFGEPV